MLKRGPARFSITVDNKPGALAKVTRVLTKEGIEVEGLTMATVGDKAVIEFSTYAQAPGFSAKRA
jgi:hypothetical protein